MKSLHQFMADKNLDLAVRFNSNLPALEKIDIKTTKSDPVSYTLFSIPLYLAQRINDLLTCFLRDTAYSGSDIYAFDLLLLPPLR